jgi:hypothetical protein
MNDLDAHFERLDRYEARRLRRALRQRDKIIVDRRGNAVVVYLPENEFDRLERIHNKGHKLFLLWETRYPNMAREFLYAVDYAIIVIDQRIGLRKTLSFRDYKYLDRYIRAAIREQIDSIIAALDDIEEMTEPSKKN